jgi:putative copper resistance protein D
MVLLAAINRFTLVPALARERSGREDSGSVLARLKRHVLYEQLLGAGVIAIVSVIGAIAPPTAGA